MSDNLKNLGQVMSQLDSDFLFDMNEDYDQGDNDEQFAAKEGQILHLKDLNKNVLYVIFSFLKSHQIFSIMKTCKKIHTKVTQDPYFKTLTAESYANFFMQQFAPPVQDYIDRMYSLASQSTAQSQVTIGKLSIVTQQSNYLKGKSSFITQNPQPLTFENPFEEAKEVSSEEQCNRQVQSKLLNLNNILEISQIQTQFHKLYYGLINQLQQMKNLYQDFFQIRYCTTAKAFSRELLLDPSECENSLYILPQLTRDAFCRKEIFNRVENLLIQNYNQCFQHPSAQKAKEQLMHAENILRSLVCSPKFKQVLTTLLSEQLIWDNMEDQQVVNQNLVIYTLFQFQTLCKAHNLEVERRTIKHKDQPYVIIDVFNDLFNHIKILIKKICSNIAVTDAFKSQLLHLGLLTNAQFQDHPYLSDLLLMNILEQIWIRILYEPHSKTMLECFRYEVVKTHNIDKYEDLLMKKTSLQKFIKIIKQNFNLQQEKAYYRQLMYEGVPPLNSDYLVASEIIENSIISLLDQMCGATPNLTEFCREMRQYQQTKFLPSDFKNFYFSNKAFYILKSFAQDFEEKLKDSCLERVMQHSKDLAYSSLVPCELQNSFFYKLILQLGRDENIKQMYGHEVIKSALFNIFYIDGQTQWAIKLNNSLLRCHQHLDGNRNNYHKSGVLMMEESFADSFVRVAETIEKDYDFDSEIKIRKQKVNEQIIKDIQERLQLIKANPRHIIKKQGEKGDLNMNSVNSNLSGISV